MEPKPTNPRDDFKRRPMDMSSARVPLGEVHVIVERCKECGYCIEYCPTKVLVYTKEMNAKGHHYPIVADGKEAACVHCRYCDLICPELAIYTTLVETGKSGGSDD